MAVLLEEEKERDMTSQPLVESIYALIEMSKEHIFEFQNQLYNSISSDSRQLSHRSSNTHLGLVDDHIEPQRKYSQCQPGHYIEEFNIQRHNLIRFVRLNCHSDPFRFSSDLQCFLSASSSSSAYPYRSRASFAGVGTLVTNQPPPSSSNTHLYSQTAVSTRAQTNTRRMSVDESQQRRQSRPTTTSGGPVVKLSLAGVSTSTGNQVDRDLHNMQISSRSRSANKSGRDDGDIGPITLQEQLKLTRCFRSLTCIYIRFSYQALMLTQTWPRIKSSVFNIVFKELSQKCPNVKELFQKTSILDGFSTNRACVDMKVMVEYAWLTR